MTEENIHFLVTTARENTRNLFEVVQNTGDVEAFLHRSSHISTRASKISRLEQDVYVDVAYDTDGIVMELASLRSINFQVRHLHCLPNGIRSLKSVYPVLKKHLNLMEYKGGETLALLRKSLGVQLFYENTWECYMALIPVKNRDLETMDDKSIVAITFDFVTRIFDTFKRKMYLASVGGKVANTLKKNSLATLTNLHIVPDEQNEVLDIMDEAMKSVSTPDCFQLYTYVFKFGERKSGCYDLGSLFDTSLTCSQTIHAAATFSLCCDLGILWSRNGIQRVVGKRGSLLSALSFKEAANFQSNLDGKKLDLSEMIRSAITFGNEIRFVQFYADVAHNYPCTFPHPVSGSIITAGMLHPSSVKQLESDAMKYIAVCKDNIISQGCELKSRLEFVIAPESTREVFEPCQFFVAEKLSDLIAREAMFVPFHMDRGELMKVIQRVGLYLVNTLSDSFQSSKRTGDCAASWAAYQCECAIEKFLWGRLFSASSAVHSVNLGPGHGTPSRSLTDTLGFLALDESTASMVEESPPPLNIWCKGEETRRNVNVLFGLHDHLRSSYAVLGRRTVLMLLKVLHFGRGPFVEFGEFLSTLKSRESIRRPHVRDRVSVGYIAFHLSQCKGVRCAFGRALQLICEKEDGVDLSEILSTGIRELDLKIFPRFKMYDSSRHRKLTWNGYDAWHILYASRDEAAEDGTSARALTCDIIRELDRQGLVHASKFKSFEPLEFPWIQPMLRKLKGCKLSHMQVQTTGLFVSCVALLQQGWYVDFKALARLEGVLPLDQHKLRQLEIQSRFLLGPLRTPRIWRIHETISVKLDVKEKRSAVVSNVSQEKRQEEEDGELEELCLAQAERCEEKDEASDVFVSKTSHIPAGTFMRWIPEELEILTEIKENSDVKKLRNRYEIYQKLCHERGVPDRPLEAFRKKFSTIK